MLKRILTILAMSIAIIILGFTGAAGQDLKPCPSQDVMFNMSSIYPDLMWMKIEKGAISNYFGGTMEGLLSVYAGWDTDWDAYSCPYGNGSFYGVELPKGTFDSEGPAWRLPKGDE